jgi:hypothetical protein
VQVVEVVNNAKKSIYLYHEPQEQLTRTPLSGSRSVYKVFIQSLLNTLSEISPSSVSNNGLQFGCSDYQGVSSYPDGPGSFCFVRSFHEAEPAEELRFSVEVPRWDQESYKTEDDANIAPSVQQSVGLHLRGICAYSLLWSVLARLSRNRPYKRRPASIQYMYRSFRTQ